MTRRQRADRDRGLAAVPETVAALEAAGSGDASGPGGSDAAMPTGLAGLAGESASAVSAAGSSGDGGRAAGGLRLGAWRGLVGLAMAVLVLPVVLAAGLTASAGPATPASARVVTADELQRDYGIRVDLVAVLAAGGLVNVRFTVIDADKAGHLLHDNAALPALYVEASGAVLRTSQAKAHKMQILDGASYFLMYPNAGGAIQRGTQVSLVVDTVRLQPIGAQS